MTLNISMVVYIFNKEDDTFFTYLKQERMENAMAMTYVIEKRGMTSFVFASNSTCLDKDVEWVT